MIQVPTVAMISFPSLSRRLQDTAAWEPLFERELGPQRLLQMVDPSTTLVAIGLAVAFAGGLWAAQWLPARSMTSKQADLKEPEPTRPAPAGPTLGTGKMTGDHDSGLRPLPADTGIAIRERQGDLTPALGIAPPRDSKATLETEGPRRILVVDDDPGIRSMLNQILSAEGYEVITEASGVRALELLQSTGFDLVVLDVKMPEISGYDLCRSIRLRHGLDDLPVLFVTGQSDSESLINGFAAGGNDYIVKPMKTDELLARVGIHLSSRSMVSYRRRLRQAVQTSQDERELRRQLFEVRERERRLLAQELHDGPIQDLHALALSLQQIPDTGHDAAEQLNQVTSGLRAICSELRPPALMYGSLAGSLRAHVARLNRRHPAIDLRLDTMEDGNRLTEWTRLQLLRIAQEALANALQHASPSAIDLGFELDAEGCSLWVRDDGTGFEVPERWIELARKEHFGLVGMAERTESIDGRLRIVSHLGSGTEMRVEVPWSQNDITAGAPEELELEAISR